MWFKRSSKDKEKNTPPPSSSSQQTTGLSATAPPFVPALRPAVPLHHVVGNVSVSATVSTASSSAAATLPARPLPSTARPPQAHPPTAQSAPAHSVPVHPASVLPAPAHQTTSHPFAAAPPAQVDPAPNSKRTPTNSSYVSEPSTNEIQLNAHSKPQYSCSNLPTNDPARFLKATEVRRQVMETPNRNQRVVLEGASANKPKPARYPRVFGNAENLPVQAEEPRFEYPVVASGSWNPRTRHTQGAARVILNKADRSKFDVAYHDPTKGLGHHLDFSLATYRPAVGVAQPKT